MDVTFFTPILLAIAAYFLPSIIGAIRKVPSVGSILVINFFLGWTLVGWVVALAMAVRSTNRVPGVQSGDRAPPPNAAGARTPPPSPATFAPPPAGTPAVPAAPPATGQWATDPYRRHELRYWDGDRWTAHVSDGGVPGLDPVDEPPPTPAAPPG